MKRLPIFAACLVVIVIAAAVIRNRPLACSFENSREVDFLKGWSLHLPDDGFIYYDEWLNDPSVLGVLSVTFDEFALWEKGEWYSTMGRIIDTARIEADGVVFRLKVYFDMMDMIPVYSDEREFVGGHGGSFSALIPIGFQPRFVAAFLPTASGCIRDITAAGADGGYLRSDAGTPG